MTEIVRGIKPFPQPSPSKNPAGDCFACSLKAVIDGLFPDTPVAFEDAWEAWKGEAYGGGKVLSNTWPTCYHACYRMKALGYDIEVFRDLVIPHFDVDTWSHAWGASIPEWPWAYRMEAWLSAGWLALAEMNYAGAGHFTADGSMNHTDHFVAIDGQRQFWKKHPTLDAHSLSHETHVVCSAKGAYWIDTQTLLRRHGVAGLTLIRKDVRDRRS